MLITFFFFSLNFDMFCVDAQRLNSACVRDEREHCGKSTCPVNSPGNSIFYHRNNKSASVRATFILKTSLAVASVLASGV